MYSKCTCFHWARHWAGMLSSITSEIKKIAGDSVGATDINQITFKSKSTIIEVPSPLDFKNKTLKIYHHLGFCKHFQVDGQGF